jgi:hypothetical protein
MDIKGQFGVDGDAARHDMKGPLEMSRADSYSAIGAITSTKSDAARNGGAASRLQANVNAAAGIGVPDPPLRGALIPG